MSRFPRLTQNIVLGGQDLPSPAGWVQRIYQTNPGEFRFEKTILDLAPDLFVEDIRLVHGALRVDGVIEEERLHIGVFESEDYRLLGFAGAPKICSISYSGSRWDAIASAPSRGLTFNAGPGVAQFIVPADKRALLLDRMRKDSILESLVIPVSYEIAALEDIMQTLMAVAEENEEEFDAASLGWVMEDLIDSAAAAIDCFLEADDPDIWTKPNYRRALAHEIEDLLWKEPGDCDGSFTLDVVAAKFGCARRTIQQAMTENFNMGFVMFKRLVRLHQANRKLRSLPKRQRITDVAYDYEFANPSRFAESYKDMFGARPRELFKRRSGDTES